MVLSTPEKKAIPPNWPAVAVLTPEFPLTIKVFAIGHMELVIPPLRAVAAFELRVEDVVNVRSLWH